MKDTVMVLGLILLYLAVVTAVDSEYFKRVLVKRKLHLLWKGRNASSSLRCAAHCVSDTSCAAHVYNATTSTCQGYRSAIQREIVQGTRAEDGYAVYYLQRRALQVTPSAPSVAQVGRTPDVREKKRDSSPVTQARNTAEVREEKKDSSRRTSEVREKKDSSRRTAGTAGINQKCNKNTKCRVPKSRCSRGTCKCSRGYYHLKTKNVCSRKGTVGINRKCNKNTKCRVTKSRCYRGICQCASGYSYQRAKKTCLKSARGTTKTGFSYPPEGYTGARGTKKTGFSYPPEGYTGARGTKSGFSYPLGSYPGTGNIEQKCPWNGQCRVVNSVCFKGTCKCIPGYSFNIPKSTCVRSCRRYGLLATLYNGIGIEGHNDKELQTRSAWDCASMCASETSFVCRSFDFQISEGCKLSSYGYLDVNEKYRETDATGWIFGTRTCADFLAG